MKSKHILFVVMLLSISFFQNAVAQKKDSTVKEFKNTIKYNISNPVIFGSTTYVIAYERVINKAKSQSFSIDIGQVKFPGSGLINSIDSINTKSSSNKSGFHLAAEYRFYLQKENKYHAPRGVYIAPYYSYNSFGRTNVWNLKTAGYNGDVNTDLSLKVHTVGVELGYQFIFWKRLTLDLILAGPGIASYDFRASIGSNLSAADKQALLDKLNQALSDKFPGYNVVLGNNDFKKTGVETLSSFNFRYVIQVGFRF